MTPEWLLTALNILIVVVWLGFLFWLISLATITRLFYVQEKFRKKQKYLLLEIKTPTRIDNPVASIEQMFHASWSFQNQPKKFVDKWVKGEHTLPYSCEIVSVEGVVRFFLRIPEANRSLFESTLQAHHSDLKIELVEDYIQLVPAQIPNQDWEVIADNFIFKKNHFHPIKVYSDFNPVDLKEIEIKLNQDKAEPSFKLKEIINPISYLLEEMNKLSLGEHLWFQIIITPIKNEIPWVKKGEAFIKAGGKEKKSESFFKGLLKAFKNFWQKGLFYELSTSKSKKKPLLSNKEKEIVEGVERKIRKYGFECVIRGLYIAPKNAFFKPRGDIIKNYLFSFTTPYSNSFTKDGRELINRCYFFKKKETKDYLKKAIDFHSYVDRDNFTKRDIMRRYFSKSFSSKKIGASVLNTEELATLYHFPSTAIIAQSSLGKVLVETIEPLKLTQSSRKIKRPTV